MLFDLKAGTVGEENMSVGLIHFRALWVFTHRGPVIKFGHICNPFGITLIHLLLSEHTSLIQFTCAAVCQADNRSEVNYYSCQSF